jgi:hypothetical protein
MMSPAVQPMPQPSMGGGKGAGPMQPQKTAMGTPIVYGNVYSNSNQPFNPQPNVPSTTNPSVTEKPYDVLQDPQFYAAADGTTSVPAYAYGTTSVSRYARGTVDVEDPWDWSKSQPMTVPMAATIKPSEAVIPQAVPDKTEQFLGQQAMGIGTNAVSKGIDAAYKAYNAPMTTQAIGSMGTTASGAPVALTNMGASAAAAPASSSLYALSAPASIGGAGTGIVAPLAAATEGAALASAGATAAGTGAATGAASGAALAGGEAALAAMGPVGMVIGGALLAKKLGIF